MAQRGRPRKYVIAVPPAAPDAPNAPTAQTSPTALQGAGDFRAVEQLTTAEGGAGGNVRMKADYIGFHAGTRYILRRGETHSGLPEALGRAIVSRGDGVWA